MPRVKGPLFSMEASGTIGKTITFDKRGFVRQRVVPANPKSDLQGNVRQMLLAVQKALSMLGVTVILSIKSIAPTSYRWNSYMLSKVIGPNSADFEASRTAFNALTGPQKSAWDDAGTALGLVEQNILYATDDAISPGLAFFAVARALYHLGFGVENGEPAGDNHEEWGAFYAS